jgi:hypothetical protein
MESLSHDLHGAILSLNYLNNIFETGKLGIFLFLSFIPNNFSIAR